MISATYWLLGYFEDKICVYLELFFRFGKV